MDAITFSPVAVFRSSAKYPSEAPRQGVYSTLSGTVEFLPDFRYEVALADLAGFDRVWLLFVFHHADAARWKPKVAPPVTAGRARYGVFATRSPHRPNPVGLSCVRLLKVSGRCLHVAETDLLSGTPILDVKPYIPEIDSFPEAKAGWRDAVSTPEWSVEFTPEAAERMAWLECLSGLDLMNFCRVQLRFNPLDRKRKRFSEDGGALFLHCRTWKMEIRTDETLRAVRVLRVCSNYSPEDLLPGAPDPYGDKEFHRAFIRKEKI